MRKFLAVLPAIALLATTACTDGNPMAPHVQESVASAASLNGAGPSLSTTSAGQSLDFNRDLDRIADLVPVFADADAGKRFDGYLGELRMHLNAGDSAEASRVLGLAQQEVAGLSSHGDRGYVEMIFRNIDAELAL